MGTGPLLSGSHMEQAETHSWPGFRVLLSVAVSAVAWPGTLANQLLFSCYSFSLEISILLSAMPDSESC